MDGGGLLYHSKWVYQIELMSRSVSYFSTCDRGELIEYVIVKF